MPIASAKFIALQQGIADGQENPVPVIKSMGFHKLEMPESHWPYPIVVADSGQRTNRKKMTPEQQDALLETIQELGREVNEGLVKDEKRLVEEWRQDGTMEIIQDVDVDAFQARCRKYFSKVLNSVMFTTVSPQKVPRTVRMNDEFDKGQATADTTGAMTASHVSILNLRQEVRQGYLATCVRVLVVLEKRFACCFLS